jgi:hypothetical protein
MHSCKSTASDVGFKDIRQRFLDITKGWRCYAFELVFSSTVRQKAGIPRNAD